MNMNTDITERIRAGCQELHHTYAINWTTAIVALGMALFAQILGLAAKHEYRQGNLSETGLESLLGLLLIAHAAILAFWVALCILAWMGPESDDSSQTVRESGDTPDTGGQIGQ